MLHTCPRGSITEVQCAKYLKLLDTMVDDTDHDPTGQDDRSRRDVRPKYAFQGPLVTDLAPDFLLRRE